MHRQWTGAVSLSQSGFVQDSTLYIFSLLLKVREFTFIVTFIFNIWLLSFPLLFSLFPSGTLGRIFYWNVWIELWSYRKERWWELITCAINPRMPLQYNQHIDWFLYFWKSVILLHHLSSKIKCSDHDGVLRL